jgi:hypothetical protein
MQTETPQLEQYTTTITIKGKPHSRSMGSQTDPMAEELARKPTTNEMETQTDLQEDQDYFVKPKQFPTITSERIWELQVRLRKLLTRVEIYPSHRCNR